MANNSLDPIIIVSVSNFLLENQAAAEAMEGRVRGNLTAELGAGHPQLEERIEHEQLQWSWKGNLWRDLQRAWARANDQEPESLIPRVDKGEGKGD